MIRRPPVVAWTRPESLEGYPQGPGLDSGHLVETNASWRVFRPVLDPAACVGCLRCWTVCPDGAIARDSGKVAFDYDFCKGCGICAHECKPKAIRMEKEPT